MLNRIYIIVGMLAIVVLAGAFIAPRFIQWSDYRDRMEDLATGVLGADVTIRGDISFSLLPTPRLEFSDVVVGDIESPAATVQGVEAEFALMDFLRDNYTVTALTLNQPQVDLVLDESGLFSSGVDIAGGGAGIALSQARISNGRIRLTDLRSEEVFTANRVDGDFRLASFSGPFQFQGFADYGANRFDVRFSTGPGDAEGISRLSASLREVANAYSVSAEGLLTAGMAPKFDGTLTYRQAPPGAEAADDIRGDLVLESKLTASTDRAVLSGFTLMPDENRAATRLTGAASVQFGARNSFDAVISGGVFSLPPRDASEVPSELPYEFVRLLGEIPAPPLPPIPGRLGIDLAEATLRGFALRDVRIDATTDGSNWAIEQAVANLPGETELRLSGTLSDEGGRAGFTGDLAMTSQRLDALSALWRKPQDNNPLFNLPGALNGRLMLRGDAFGLTGGRFTFSGETHLVEMRIGFGDEPRFDGTATLGTLNASQTAALQALLPNVLDTSFAHSFPDGSFSLMADSVDVLGLPAVDLVAEAQWSPQTFHFSRLYAAGWGGLSLDANIVIGGTLAEPRITGSGDIGVTEADAPALDLFYETVGLPYGWQQGLAGAWPADLQFILSDGDNGSGQVLTLGGTLGAGDFDLRAEMADGLPAVSTGDLRLIASLEGDAEALQAQFGFADRMLFEGTEPLIASLFFEGSGVDAFEGRAAVSMGNQSLSYFGNLALAADGQVSGDGTLEANFEPGHALAALAGVGGASFGALDATAALSFDGVDTLALNDISAVMGSAGVRGNLLLGRTGNVPSFTGDLEADALDAGGLAAALFGTEALLGVGPEDGPWPEGPLAASTAQRQTRGDIAIRAEEVTANGVDILGSTDFNYVWDAGATSLRNFKAEAGSGTMAMNLTLCCSGPLSDRTLSGRVTLAGVDLDAVTPGPIASGLGGLVDGGLQFEGTGASLADVMRAMTGEGNFSIADFAATGLSSGVFPSIAAIDDALNTDAATLETMIGLGLSGSDFTADLAQGAFTIAGGTARLANLIIEGQGGRLAGSLNLVLARLGLDGSFVLTPRDDLDPAGLVQADTARIVTTIGGTLASPQIVVDLAEMVAAIQVRANELEVDRLEAMRIEDEARQREAAEARNRLIAEQQRQRAEAEAQRIAAEEAARMLELEQQPAPPPAAPPATPPTTVTPGAFDLQLPQVNQPIGNGVNQPLNPF
ncbi:AsmA family protein [Devosia rhizoryzae]|uniref:AsmA family protein n=1 Tax=Devosia rhizoryzae TaxID=2774137 RepID=A0ABX7CAB3_9HYPH|nr:AsmA family protein [Devosia rhizoryzae]QQR40199.1 AsmA family protein [Devosia rhizoryzae]